MESSLNVRSACKKFSQTIPINCSIRDVTAGETESVNYWTTFCGNIVLEARAAYFMTWPYFWAVSHCWRLGSFSTADESGDFSMFFEVSLLCVVTCQSGCFMKNTLMLSLAFRHKHLNGKCDIFSMCFLTYVFAWTLYLLSLISTWKVFQHFATIPTM